MVPSATPGASVVLSWSGGKDSAMALDALRADQTCEVVGLLTTVTSHYDRVSIHGVRRGLLRAQAESIGLPLWEATLEPSCSNEQYEATILASLERLRANQRRLDAIAFGDLFLADVRTYRETLVAKSGLRPLFPLWGRDTRALAREVIARGFDVRLVCVDTQVLAPSFAGRAFDLALLSDLPDAVDPCGENGEFHTFVASGPGFRTSVAYDVGEVVIRDDRFAFCDLLPQPAPASLAR